MKLLAASILLATTFTAQVGSVTAKLGDEWNPRDGANAEQKFDRHLGSNTGSGSSKSKSGSKADLVADIGTYPGFSCGASRRLQDIPQKHRELCRRLDDLPQDDDRRRLCPTCEAPSGTVEMSFKKNGDIIIKLDLSGLTPNCSPTTGSHPNDCGIHIHEGTTCNSGALIGGHFWKTAQFTSDPWASFRYTSDASGTSTTKVTLSGGNGYGEDINSGRAFVIHGNDGSGVRIGCGLLEKA